jgi:hypothetical protein
VITGLRDALESVFNWLQWLWDKAEPFRQFLATTFTVAVSAVKLGIDYLKGAFEGVRDAIQWVIDKANAAIAPLKKIVDLAQKIADLSPSGSADFYPPGDPRRDAQGNASGGWVAPHTLTWVGEKGPELLQFGSTAGYVTPNYRADTAALAAVGDSRMSDLREFIGLQVNGDVKLDGLDLDGAMSIINFRLAA